MLDVSPGSRLDASHHDSADRLDSLRVSCGRIWTVVQTYPQAERWARDNLLRSGYRIYLPFCLVLRRDPVLHTLTRRAEEPLFPGYLFCELGENEPWTPIRYSRGVLRLLMSQGKPGHVNAEAVEAIRASDEARRTTPTSQPAAWRVGPVAAPAIGILAGHRGVVLRTTRTHAVLAIMLLGALREITLPLDCLEPAS